MTDLLKGAAGTAIQGGGGLSAAKATAGQSRRKPRQQLEQFVGDVAVSLQASEVKGLKPNTTTTRRFFAQPATCKLEIQ